MKQAVLVFAIALVITLAIGPAVINYLRKMKFGQKILEIGPKWHMNKQNIPTMGGFMFIIGIAAAVIIGNIVMGEISVSSLAVLGLAVAYGAVGLVDDYAKIKKKENAGLTPKQKLEMCIRDRACCDAGRVPVHFSGGDYGGVYPVLPDAADPAYRGSE